MAMAIEELADDATKDDINQYVDQVMQNEEEDRVSGDLNSTKGLGPGETTTIKADSQKIAEDNDTPVTVEKDSDSEDTADKGDEAGTSENQAWLDDDLKAEVATYGIDEKRISDFTSREELDRALRLFDQTAQDAGRKAMAEGDKGKKQDEEAGSSHDEQEPKEGQYEIGLNKDEYDEDLVDEFTKLRDHYESRLDVLESRFAETDARAEEQKFDGLVDSLSHADLFGKTGKENSKQLQRRQDLIVAVKAQQIGLQQLGRSVDLDESLVNRVARMVFADELSKKDWKSKTRSMSKQSNGRQGGGATRAQGPEETPEEFADRYYKELESV